MKNLKRMAVMMLVTMMTVTQSNIVTLAANVKDTETMAMTVSENDIADEEDGVQEESVQEDESMLVFRNDTSKIEINATNFPDEVFREKVSSYFDRSKDGYLDESEIADAINFNISECEFTNVKGIENLTALKSISITKCNSIEEFDLSKNEQLEKVTIYRSDFDDTDFSFNSDIEHIEITDSKLSEIDLSDYAKLNYLNIDDNNISTIDLSNNKELVSLYVNENSFKSLDLTNNTKLETLFASGLSKLESIDLSKNTELKDLRIEDGKVKELDLTNNIKLDRLDCSGSKIESVILSNSKLLASVDFSGCEYIEKLDLSNCTKLTYLNAPEAIMLSEVILPKDNVVSTITLNGCKIGEIDLSGCKELTSLIIKNNPLKKLDLSNCGKLYTLTANDCRLEEINLNGAAKLSTLKCDNNQLKMLDVSKQPLLVTLECNNNLLTELDLNNNRRLANISCEKNNIKFLDLSSTSICAAPGYMSVNIGNQNDGLGQTVYLVSHQHNVLDSKGLLDNRNIVEIGLVEEKELEIDKTFIDEYFREYVANNIDLDGNNKLSDYEINAVNTINCYDSKIESIKGVEVFTSLERLNVSGKIGVIDLSSNVNLERITLDQCDFVSINLSKNVNLISVSIKRNKNLKKLDFRNNPKLVDVVVDNNSLDSIVFYEDGKNIESLTINDNELTKLDVSKMEKLNYISCENNNITELDLKNCGKLLPSNRSTLAPQKDNIKMNVTVTEEDYEAIKDSNWYEDQKENGASFDVHKHEIDTTKWVEDGETHYQVCSSCSRKLNEEKHELSKVEATDPTCAVAGVKAHYKCKCGLFEDALGLVPIKDFDGWKKENAIATIEHTWDGGVVTISPSFYKEGTKEFTCAKCSAKKVEILAKANVLEAPVKGKVDVKSAAIYALTVSGNDAAKTAKMKFKVDNKKIATVTSKGVLKAKKTGTVKVSVLVRNESKKYVEACVVTVDIKDTAVEKKVNVTSLNDTVDLNKLVKNVPAGYSVKFELTGSNAKKAEIKDNILKPLKKGTITVKCTINDESKYALKKSIKIVVKLPKK